MTDNKHIELRAYDTELEKYIDEGEFVFYSYGNCECEFIPNSIKYAHDTYHISSQAIRNSRFEIEMRIDGGEWFKIQSGRS